MCLIGHPSYTIGCPGATGTGKISKGGIITPAKSENNLILKQPLQLELYYKLYNELSGMSNHSMEFNNNLI
jgi:hypothetical protein